MPLDIPPYEWRDGHVHPDFLNDAGKVAYHPDLTIDEWRDFLNRLYEERPDLHGSIAGYMEMLAMEEDADRHMGRVRKIHPVPLGELAPMQKITSKIQDQKRNFINGKPSRWPDRMEDEFAKLEEWAADPYAALDLEYLRDISDSNRSFGYVVTYETFLAPERDASGGPEGIPTLRTVVKVGDGGQESGYSVGKTSGSIISRVVRSYWNDPNMYSGVLQGVVIPGNDRNISKKIGQRVGGSELQIRGDVWDIRLLDHLSIDDLLRLLEAPFVS